MTAPESVVPEDVSPVRIGGMVVGYFFVCRRKAWLTLHDIEMEGESDAVAMGRLIHETSYTRRRHEVQIGDIKLDWVDLQAGVIHEVKKSPAVEEAHLWQLRYYLYVLGQHGVTAPDGGPFRGEINYPKLRRTEAVALEPAHAAELERTVAALHRLATDPVPPDRIANRKFCRACAFHDLCWSSAAP